MHEDKGLKFEELDQILMAAQLRRSSDLGMWLKQYIEGRRAARLQKAMSPPESTMGTKVAAV